MTRLFISYVATRNYNTGPYAEANTKQAPVLGERLPRPRFRGPGRGKNKPQVAGAEPAQRAARRKPRQQDKPPRKERQRAVEQGELPSRPAGWAKAALGKRAAQAMRTNTGVAEL